MFSYIKAILDGIANPEKFDFNSKCGEISTALDKFASDFKNLSSPKTVINYQTIVEHFAYIYRYGARDAALMSIVVRKIRNKLKVKGTLNILSVGGGAGIDLLGLYDCKMGIKHTCLDKNDWRDEYDVVKEIIDGKRAKDELTAVEYTYVKKDINDINIKELVDFNLFIFLYSASEFDSKDGLAFLEKIKNTKTKKIVVLVDNDAANLIGWFVNNMPGKKDLLTKNTAGCNLAIGEKTNLGNYYVELTKLNQSPILGGQNSKDSAIYAWEL